MIMKNGLKTTALSFGVAILLGCFAIGCGGTDTVEKTSESQHSDTVTAAPAPAVVMVQPAPAVVTQEHSSSNATSDTNSPNGSSTSEKSSSSSASY
jgi:hypothetical protein